jgi:hypothetical protein
MSFTRLLNLVVASCLALSLMPEKSRGNPVAGAALGVFAIGDAASSGGISLLPTTTLTVAGIGFVVYKSYKGIEYILQRPAAPEEQETHIVTFCQGFNEERMEFFFANRKSLEAAAMNFKSFQAMAADSQERRDIEQALAFLKSSPNGANLVVQLLQIRMGTAEIDEFLLKSLKTCL